MAEKIKTALRKWKMSKMKKFLLFLSGGSVAYLIFWFAYMHFIPEKEKKFIENLESEISSGQRKIDLQEVTDFGWDRVCLVQVLDVDRHMKIPKLTRKEIEGLLNVNLENFRDRIPILEHTLQPPSPAPTFILVILFIENKEIKQVLRFKNNKLQDDNSVFRIVNWEDWLVCAPADKAVFSVDEKDGTIALREEKTNG